MERQHWISITVRAALQDVLTAQPAVLIGLIAHLVGTPLQDDIVRTTGRLLRLGQDILATSAVRGPPAAVILIHPIRAVRFGDWPTAHAVFLGE
jgi:hypothetical protein